MTPAPTAVSDILESHFEVYPSAARDIGRHDYDACFPDIFRPSPETILDMRRRLVPHESAADPELRADVRTLLAWLDRESFRVDVLGRRHRGPMECLGEVDVWGYIKKPYDTVEEKVAALEAHLSGVPRFLQEAGRLLDRSLPAGERLRSIEFARALAVDIRDVVELLAIEHPGLRATRLDSPAQAAAACEEFARVVDATAPTSGVLGPERLAEWVRVAEGVDGVAADLVEEAQAEVDAIVSALDSFAAQFGVRRRRDLYDLMEQSGPTDATLDTLQRVVARLRRFWVDRDVVCTETVNPLEFRRRPRMFAAAQFGLSGPFEEDGHPHYLYLPEHTDSPEQARPRPRLHLPVLEMLAVHETYAGHYLHAEAAFRHTRGPRTCLRLWAGFVEGWAHYAEELAIEQGLAEGRPLVHVAQLLAALEAATRLLVHLSVHAGRWTFSEAVQHTALLCDWPAHQAAREVLTATSDWRAGLYTFGKLRIRQWRRAVGAGTSPSALKGFHDRLVQCGFAPLGVVWQYYHDSQQEETNSHARDHAECVPATVEHYRP